VGCVSFYGFPSHYYKEKFPNVGSKEIANKVLSALKEAGIKAEGVKRGLDHGVWASFKCGKCKCLNMSVAPIGGQIVMIGMQHLTQTPTP
jgi:hypothetical protein